MRPALILSLCAALAPGLPALAQETGADPATLAGDLASPDSFADIADDEDRAAAIFQEMAKVLTHPRCLNCHPVTGGPTQGNDMRPHMPPVIRGEADFGAPGMTCNTCHGPRNVTLDGLDASIPGHEPWQLAPVSMGWVGLGLSEICEQLKDPERNGGKTLAELQVHNAEDGLVGWGWEPGEGRLVPPGDQAQFGALTQAWIDSGASCPS